MSDGKISMGMIALLFMLAAGISFLRMETEIGVLCAGFSVLLAVIKPMLGAMEKRSEGTAQEGY